MNIFETEYLQMALLAAFITTIFVSAITVTFEKFFTSEIKSKILVLLASVIITALTVDIDLSDWQKLLTKIIITISFAVLFYNYLGGKFIKMLFLKVKKMLPGYGETDVNQ